jgi:hypothetical protein
MVNSYPLNCDLPFLQTGQSPQVPITKFINGKGSGGKDFRRRLASNPALCVRGSDEIVQLTLQDGASGILALSYVPRSKELCQPVLHILQAGMLVSGKAQVPWCIDILAMLLDHHVYRPPGSLRVQTNRQTCWAWLCLHPHVSVLHQFSIVSSFRCCPACDAAWVLPGKLWQS